MATHVLTLKALGNWFARQGMAQEFIKTDEARTHARENAEAMTVEISDEDEDEDDTGAAAD